MNYFIGVDPGINTGVSLLDENLKDCFHTVLDAEELGFREVVKTVLNLVYETEMSKGPVHVVIESFNLFPHTAREVAAHDGNLLTSQIIGALRYSLPEDKVTWQIPAMKAGCPDEELRHLGLWIKHGGPDKRHIHDSLRHVVVYLRRKENAERIG